MGDILEKQKKRRIRLRTLFLLAITLASNSFAWFVYSTKVSNNITARVKSWNVDFEIGTDSQAEEYIEISIDSLYPGMEDFSKTLKAVNHGESDARISYTVEKALILGDDLLNLGLQNEQIINKLSNDYPFTIKLNVSNTVVPASGGEANISIEIIWPYESGNDEEDTYWGNRAYDYHEENSTLPSINVIIKITAYQVE